MCVCVYFKDQSGKKCVDQANYLITYITDQFFKKVKLSHKEYCFIKFRFWK